MQVFCRLYFILGNPASKYIWIQPFGSFTGLEQQQTATGFISPGHLWTIFLKREPDSGHLDSCTFQRTQSGAASAQNTSASGPRGLWILVIAEHCCHSALEEHSLLPLTALRSGDLRDTPLHTLHKQAVFGHSAYTPGICWDWSPSVTANIQGSCVLCCYHWGGIELQISMYNFTTGEFQPKRLPAKVICTWSKRWGIIFIFPCYYYKESLLAFLLCKE